MVGKTRTRMTDVESIVAIAQGHLNQDSLGKAQLFVFTLKVG